MLEVKNISILIDDNYYIKDLSFSLNKNDKLAIIGEEGNGKSTLLKAILGICSYAKVEGSIRCNSKIGYLEQTIEEQVLNQTVFDFLFQDNVDYWNKINDWYKYLEVLQLSDTVLEQTMRTLSGGEKVKVRIMKLLLEENDILFLDEPTNDLDLPTLNWLEHFINRTTKPIVYVSHDEVLLEKTANKILHLERIKHKTECRCTLKKASYEDYIAARLGAIEKQTQIAKKEKREFEQKQEKLRQIMQKVEYQQNTISRSNPHGGRLLKKKMHALKSQERKWDNSKRTEQPDLEEAICFFFDEVYVPKTKTILNLNIPKLTVNEKILSQNIILEIIGNSHVGILGKNGVGKSTLLKEIKKQLEKREDIKVGYMPQNYEDTLPYDAYVLDYLVPSKKQEEITKARTYLGNMKFTKEEMTGKIKTLSNGTKAKLFLVKFAIDKCNCLLLDEPTRNVSPLSNPVIRNVLKNFQGTIISISHDRKYIEEVCNSIYLLTPDGLKRPTEKEFFL